METHFFNYQGIDIEYKLYRKKVKNINLRVTPKEEIVISAGKTVPLALIENFAQEKAEWIIRNIAAIEKYNQSKPNSILCDGKTVYYLGKPYILAMCQGSENCIQKREGEIILQAKEPGNQEKLKKIYLQWLRKEANTVFMESLERLHERIAPYGVKMPLLRIRNMKTRWGSCSYQKGSICLNLQLMKASEKCIDQVVLHELIHFIYPNHSKDFYGMLTRLMPDWKERKADMEKNYKDGI